jgi:hypothetical protein
LSRCPNICRSKIGSSGRGAPDLLNRFCDSVLENAAKFARGESSGYEKLLALDRFLEESSSHIAVVFHNRRRSTFLFQIAAAAGRGIMSESELKSFSEETQERVRTIVTDERGSGAR